MGNHSRRAVLLSTGAAVLAASSRVSQAAPPPELRSQVPGLGELPADSAGNATDPFRPAYHYSPAKGNLADPNGLI